MRAAVQQRLGALSSHLRDVLTLPPELMRIDLASFPVDDRGERADVVGAGGDA